ncbi:MAG: 8-amino-7-oxononanoate synthase [Verrucomicrobia bacterium]|nr:8-amino-7-oxononanoate synthase [Verrucomicrobiota bacterium]
MTPFEVELISRLEAIRSQGLYRQLRRVDSPQVTHVAIEGKTFLNFSSNDYLGLANELALKEAAIKAIERYGAGSGASRLICGSLAPHCELEDLLAQFKNCEAALTFSTGYAAAVGTICALMSKEDVIILDKLVHASIVDAARLSGAKLRVFDHNDLSDLEKILKWSDERGGTATATERSQVLIVTESIFSMDGDCAPLVEIVHLKNKYGAWLMVDEAHGTGLYGANRRGFAEELNVSDQIEIQMGTLGKAIGASGGYICGSRALIDLLVNRARSFIFSTAPVPASSAAASAGIRLVQSAEGEKRQRLLWERVRQSRTGIPLVSPSEAPDLFEIRNRQDNVFGGVVGKISTEPVGADSLSQRERETRADGAIIPIIIGDETKTLEAAAALRERGIFVPAVRYPTVARGVARLRVTLTAAHSNDDVTRLLAALKELGIPQSKRHG